MKNCYLCGGIGEWIDATDQKVEICPLCHPAEREIQGRQSALAIQERNLYWDFVPAKIASPLFTKMPWLLVVHSGEKSGAVAEYLQNLIDGRKCSAHLAWSKKKFGFVQMVTFNRVGWHVAGSKLGNNDRLNFCSIGIELPGPWDKKRGVDELNLFRQSLNVLLQTVPSLTTVTTHAHIDANKRDPGPGFDQSWVEDFGLEIRL